MNRSRAFSLALLIALLAVPPRAYSQDAPPADPQIAQGQAAYDAGDFAKAIALWEPVLVRLRAAPHTQSLAILDEKLGIAYYNISNARKARDAFEDAIAVDRELNNEAGLASDLGNLGNVEENLGLYDDALSLHQQALALHRKLKDRRGEANDLNGIGNVDDDLDRYDDALTSYNAALAAHREMQNREAEANDLGDIGIVDANLSRYEDALAVHQQALAIQRQVGNALGEANELQNIGNVESRLGRSTDALASYQAALSVHRRIGNRSGEAGDLGDIASVYKDLARYDDALDLYRQALAIDREIEYRSGEAGELSNIGNVQGLLGRYGDALDSLQQALAIHRELKLRLGEAIDLGSIGDNDNLLGRYDDALAAHRQALAINREIKNRFGEAGNLNDIGLVEVNLGRYDDAQASLTQALSIQRDIKNLQGEANGLGNLADLATHRGRYEEALATHEQALALHRALMDRLGEANELGSIGIVEKELGRYDDAIRSHEAALAIDRAIKSRSGEAADLNNLGNVYQLLGRYDDALSSLQEGLSVDRAINNRLGEANQLLNIGSVEEDLGRYDIALNSMQQALTIYLAIKNLSGQALAVGNIGIVETSLGRYDDALHAHQLSLSVNREVKNPSGEAAALTNLGVVEQRLGRNDDAVASYRQSLAMQRAIGNPLGEAENLIDIGVVEEARGRDREALASARAAQTINASLQDPEVAWHALRSAALAESHLDQRAAALADYDAALAQIESLRTALTQTERSGFFSNKGSIYDEYIAYLLDLDHRFPGQGYDRKALEIFERKSARAVLEQIGQSAAQHFRGVPRDVVAGENAATADVARAQSLVSKLLATSGADPVAIASAQQDLTNAKARLTAIETAIAAQYPAYFALRHPQPLTALCAQAGCSSIAAFQQSVLRPGELVLIYDTLETHGALWVIDRDRVQLFPIAGRRDIDSAVARVGAHVAGMLTLLSRGSAAKLERGADGDLPAFAADSYALYRLLVPDAAAAAIAQARSLIVVPSGSLYGLAFETLVTTDPASVPRPHYLIEDLPVSYMPSASLLSVVRESYGVPSAGRSPLLAFANPTFGTAPDEARPPSTVAALQLAAARSAFRGDSGAAPLGDTVFPSLPGTQTEADAVRTALGAAPASLVTGEAATRQRVLDLSDDKQLANYRYVLFATHAVLPSEVQGLTQPAIVLAHPERGDGLLTMGDVFGLSLDADFVTLSACSTGVASSDASGESISGLTRAFLYAGTPAISVTLWEVDDAAAPQITPPFFAAMHAGQLSAAEALRRAKLAMLASPQARFRHPYAWGPSVIFGDGDRP